MQVTRNIRLKSSPQPKNIVPLPAAFQLKLAIFRASPNRFLEPHFRNWFRSVGSGNGGKTVRVRKSAAVPGVSDRAAVSQGTGHFNVGYLRYTRTRSTTLVASSGDHPITRTKIMAGLKANGAQPQQ